MTSTPTLDSLASPFRSRYLSHEEVAQQLRGWATAYPQLARVEVIGHSDEGRELLVLVVGTDPDRVRPAIWIDGNMHASELAGSSAALAIAEDALRLHLTPDSTCHELSQAARDTLRDVVFHVMPRLSPDGAEMLLSTRRFVRSSPRDTRDRQQAYWVGRDMDGDGKALTMRVVDPAGDYTALDGHPDVLRPRTVEDEGPFYRLFPEGVIENFDGFAIPDPNFLSDNETDLNRNFPFGWKPEPIQIGAGGWPLSAPESRAVVEYTSARPHLFCWINFHCFGGVFIRPPGDVPDSKMDPEELALYRQLEDWAERFTGYPTVSGYEEFTYEPDKPIYGDIVSYAHEVRGCLSWAVELWDFFTQLEMPRPKRFVELYWSLGAVELERMVAFDKAHNEGRMFAPWVAIDHPQLGPAEVGGFDPLIGMWNPPYERLAQVCVNQAAVALRMAAMAPRVQLTVSVRTGDVPGLHQLDIEVTNTGYLPTYVLASAKSLAWNEGLYLTVETDGPTLCDAGQARIELGHLEGWGRGRHNPGQALFFPRSRGSSNRRRVTLTVQGDGELTLRAGSCRVGHQQQTIALTD